ncbi:hypothetical protein AHAS_Ahas03G0233300 [Arachis hypogaea]
MPLYAKFMKELLSKKRTLKGDEIMLITKECSAIIQKKNCQEKCQFQGAFKFHSPLEIQLLKKSCVI